MLRSVCLPLSLSLSLSLSPYIAYPPKRNGNSRLYSTAGLVSPSLLRHNVADQTKNQLNFFTCLAFASVVFVVVVVVVAGLFFTGFCLSAITKEVCCLAGHAVPKHDVGRLENSHIHQIIISWGDLDLILILTYCTSFTPRHPRD